MVIILNTFTAASGYMSCISAAFRKFQLAKLKICFLVTYYYIN